MTEKEILALTKPRRPVVFVETSEQLQEAVRQLREIDSPIAIDAERASGFRYSQRAYLVQISRASGNIFLIDSAKIFDEHGLDAFEGLSKLLAAAEWILHAATQDLPCLAELNLKPASIFDTELGSRIAGLPRVGLGAVVEHYLHIGLAKEHSAVDWSLRPLDSSWLDYAALDVDVLHELATELQKDLENKGKLVFAKEEFDHLLLFKPKAVNPERWRATSGLHEVKTETGLSIARSLWQARETLARKLDVAPGRLIPDSSIAHVSLAIPKSKPELASNKQFAGRASRSYLDTWWTAIQDGIASKDKPATKVTHTGIPNHRSWPNRWPDASRRLILVRAALQQVAEQLDIPQENLVSPEAIRQICWPDRVEIDLGSIEIELKNLRVRNWQISLIAQPIVDQLQKANQPENSES